MSKSVVKQWKKKQEEVSKIMLLNWMIKTQLPNLKNLHPNNKRMSK